MNASVPCELARVDGWGINLPDQATAVSEIIAAARQGEPFSVFTLNLDHIVKLRQEPAFREAYEAARFVTADGAPIALLASRQDKSVKRTTGADLVVPLCEAAARAQLDVFLFGSDDEVLSSAGRKLVERTIQHSGHELGIAGTEAPPYGFDPTGPEADAAIDRIVASGAKLCFVALGAPKQELFAAHAVARGAPVGFVCIGAALDFIAGRQSRAPAIVQKSGLEWLWRLSTNPRRLTGRYARCAVVLGDLVLSSALQGKRRTS